MLSAVWPPSVGSSASGFSRDDDLLDDFRRDRLDVGAVRELRVGHDRGRIRVDQHDLVAFFLQRLAGLHAGVVEFAALPDDDGAGADDENFVDARCLWAWWEAGLRRAVAAKLDGVWQGFPACKGLDFRTSGRMRKSRRLRYQTFRPARGRRRVPCGPSRSGPRGFSTIRAASRCACPDLLRAMCVALTCGPGRQTAAQNVRRQA